MWYFAVAAVFAVVFAFVAAGEIISDEGKLTLFTLGKAALIGIGMSIIWPVMLGLGLLVTAGGIVLWGRR
jgi:hypothetical protein